MLAFIVWSLPKTAFTLPYFNISVYWYSLFFAVGLYGSLLIAKKLLRDRASAQNYTSPNDQAAIRAYADSLFIYIFVGILIGARAGHVLFYDWAYYREHLLEILNIRQGGLSSHGGVVGLFCALATFAKKAQHAPFLPRGKDTLDLVCISSGWAAFCIRLGNLMNQEIIGTPSSVPWAIIFTDPVDGLAGVPRHPAQLYEALFSLVLLGIFLFIGKKGLWARNGLLAGYYLLATFSARCLIEIVKAPQCIADAGTLHVGQWLSLPLILFALYLIISAQPSRRREE